MGEPTPELPIQPETPKIPENLNPEISTTRELLTKTIRDLRVLALPNLLLNSLEKSANDPNQGKSNTMEGILNSLSTSFIEIAKGHHLDSDAQISKMDLKTPKNQDKSLKERLDFLKEDMYKTVREVRLRALPLAIINSL